MARERPKLSAKKWAETDDSTFKPTVVNLPEGVNFFSPKKAGTYRLEIVPYEVPRDARGGQNPNAQPGELHYERTYFSHRGIGADERSYVCPARTAGRPCPICEHRKELMRDRDADEDLIKALAPKQRQLWNVYDHGDPDKGVQVWDVSYHLFGRQLKATINNGDEDDGWEYFADPDDGLTLRVGMDEKSFAGNTFLECATIGFKPRKSKMPDSILDKAQPLDDLLIVMDYAKLKSIFLQEEGLDHDSLGPSSESVSGPKDDDDDEPAPKKQTRSSKPKKDEKPVTCSDLGIGKGDDCSYEGKVWTIIRVSDDGETVTLSNDDDDVKKGIKASELKPPEEAKTSESEEPKGKEKKASSDDDDWDADFDDPPKKEEKPKQSGKGKSKQKDEPKKEEAKQEQGGDDDWDNW